MKSGFIIIELLVATVISAMLGAALFYSFNIINKYVGVIDNYTDKNLKIATMHQQFEKDLLGTFVPVAAMKPIEEKPPETTQPKPGQPQAQEKKAVEEKKPQAKPLGKIFYGINKENNIDILSFITGNSLQAYWSKQTGKAKPRIVRVVYRLMPDKEVKNSFNLLRSEGNDLKFDSYKPGGTKEIKEFTMIEGIKSLSMHYTKEKKDEKNKDSKEKEQKKKKEFITLKEWKVEAQGDDKAKKDTQDKQLIPNAVVIKGEVWDKDKKRAHGFEFKFELNPGATSLEEAKQTNIQQKGPFDAYTYIEKNFPEDLRGMFQRPQRSQSQANATQNSTPTISIMHNMNAPANVPQITTKHAHEYLAQSRAI
jgi:hypothetical protein